MENVVTIRKQWEVSEPLPTDFVGTKKFIEKTKILEKIEGVSFSAPMQVPFGVGSYSTRPAYFIFVMTQFGHMWLEVSEELFNLLEKGEQVIVRYRRGRWTGALKGNLASR